MAYCFGGDSRRPMRSELVKNGQLEKKVYFGHELCYKIGIDEKLADRTPVVVSREALIFETGRLG